MRHAASDEAPPRPLHRCFPNLPAWIDSAVPNLLDEAAALFDRADFEGALACAEEAARQAPRSAEAHHDRVVALTRLGRHDEARDVLAHLLALGPTDVESLELAADFFINQIAPSAERATIGLEYARRALRGAAERERRERVALLEGQALIDLGRAEEALKPLALAMSLNPKDASARYERGVALFELCRFDAAQRAFESVVALDPQHAHALYHLGLIAERRGQVQEAAQRFAAATAADATAFPAPPELSPGEFAARVRGIVARLPADVLRDLDGIPVETADLPALDDLVAESPPLSPTILGLYRGLPLGRDVDDDAAALPKVSGQGRAVAAVARPPSASGGPTSCATPERTIVLYRRNLLRSVSAPGQVDEAITRTLLHEVGHLRGEDDGSLRDRGLE